MSAAACKIIINDQTGDLAGNLLSRIRQFEKLMAMPGADEVMQSEVSFGEESTTYYDRAIAIDAKVTRHIKRAVEAYDELNNRLANAL